MHHLYLQEINKLRTHRFMCEKWVCFSLCFPFKSLWKPCTSLQNTVSLWDALGWRGKVNSCRRGQ